MLSARHRNEDRSRVARCAGDREPNIMFVTVQPSKSALHALTPEPPDATRYLASWDRHCLRVPATLEEGDT
jgi:hypothetical protein